MLAASVGARPVADIRGLLLASLRRGGDRTIRREHGEADQSTGVGGATAPLPGVVPCRDRARRVASLDRWGFDASAHFLQPGGGAAILRHCATCRIPLPHEGGRPSSSLVPCSSSGNCPHLVSIGLDDWRPVQSRSCGTLRHILRGDVRSGFRCHDVLLAFALNPTEFT